MATPRLEDKDQKFLVCDPSASHLSYVLCEYDSKAKELFISAVGMLWTKADWSRGNRFLYMNRAFETIIQSRYIPTTICSEQYFIAGSKFGAGVAVIPIINGLLEMNCAQFNLKYLEVPPPSWRSTLGIKFIKDASGKRDYKTPTKDMVLKSIQVPEEIESNITRKPRATPHDMFDALAITLAMAKELNVKKVTVDNAAFLPFDLIEKLHNISKEIQ